MKLITRTMIMGVLTSCMVGGSLAQQVKPDDAIEYRQGVMQAVRWNFVPLGAMAKGAVPYNAEVVSRNAARLEFLAKQPLEGFTPGTEKGSENKTTAKPEIWQNFDKFKSLFEKMETESGKLAQVAKGGDEKATLAQIGEIGKVCKSCHDDFRVKR